MKPYKLMGSLYGHTGDVKSLCATRDNGGFVSVSRDLTAKLWRCDNSDNSNQYAQVQTITTHKKYVNACVVVYTLNEYPNGLIITGSNDQTIAIHDIQTDKQLAQLKAHDGAVCTLYFDNQSRSNLLYSGSFDSTAKVWNLSNFVADNFNLNTSLTIRGHAQTVWSVVGVEKQHVVLTGSADKTIQHWQMDSSKRNVDLVCKYIGHTDCVRGIALSSTNSQEFFSCSNDGCVIQWQLTVSNPIRIFRVTDSFLYSINMLYSNDSTDCMFITSGEDRTLRIHSVSKSANEYDTSGCVQSIALPCQTLWYGLCLPNGNLAVACSDGSIRLFTQKQQLMATKSEQEQYETELAQFAIPVKTNEAMSQIDRTQLPSVEALAQPGRKDGQTLMINNDNEIEVYQWSKADDRWIKIGVAVGSSSAGGGSANRPKTSYLGKEYDYVFDIQLDDENTSLKLPYNVSEDPYVVAQNFILRHELSQTYLDEIANFIVKNTQSETIGSMDTSSYCDPFTGANRYVPPARGSTASSTAPPIVSSQTFSADPFTGASSYNAANNKQANSLQLNEYFPHFSFILFDQMNFGPILKKLREFQQQIASAYKDSLITDKNNIDLIENLLNEAQNLTDINQVSDQIELLFQMIETWPVDFVFPLIDLVRILVLNKQIAVYLTRQSNLTNFANKQGQHSANYYFDTLLKYVQEDKVVTTMLVVKVYCNLFNSLNEIKSNNVHKLLNYLLHERLFLINRLNRFVSNQNKSLQIAFTTLLLNYTVVIEKLYDYKEKYSSSFLSDVSLELIEYFNSVDLNENLDNFDFEAIFRVLVSIGTLISKTNAIKETDYFVSIFKSLEVAKSKCAKIVQKSEKYPEKVSKSAGYLVKLLD